ncbi:Ig-like domain-containing protein [Acidobacteriota bacterium]
MKNRTVILACIFGMTILLPILTFAPVNRSLEVEYISEQSSHPMQLLGAWLYGECSGSALDPNRNLAWIGNGEALQSLDISSPGSLSVIGEVNLNGSPQDIVISGKYAYIVTHSSLKIVDISDPSSPIEVASEFMSGSSLRSLSLDSDFAYLAANERGLLIYDVSDPYNPVMYGEYDEIELFVLDVAIWGEYAICECQYYKYPDTPDYPYGLEIIDISSPSAPSLVGTWQLDEGCVSAGMDVTADGYAYICQRDDTSKTSKVTAVNIAKNPRKPKRAGSYVESGCLFKTLTVSGDTAYLYDDLGMRFVTLNIASPSVPAYIGECELVGAKGLDVRGSLVGVAGTSTGFSLLNVSDPGHPSELGTFETPGGPSSNGKSTVASGDYVYMACGGRGLRILDVSDPSNPLEAGVCEFTGSGALAISGKYAYCASHAALDVVDISSPNSPVLVARLDLSEENDLSYLVSGVAVQGDYAYVTGNLVYLNSSRGYLRCIDISDPLEPRKLGIYDCVQESFHSGGIGVAGDYAYMALSELSLDKGQWGASLRVVDISDPFSPSIVFKGIWTEGTYASGLAMKGDLIYMTGDRFRILEISDPRYPEYISSFPVRCEHLAISGDFAYLTLDRLMVLYVYNPKDPHWACSYSSEWPRSVAASGNRVFLGGSLKVLKNKFAPTVSIVSPRPSSTLLGSVPIEVKASHSTGIRYVQFYVDDSFVVTQSTPPFTYVWDTASEEDGLHTIRVRAANNNGMESEVAVQVYTRSVHPPLNFSGQKTLNRSLSQAEYFNVLSWQANPNNRDVAKYRIFRVEGNDQSLLAEFNGDVLEYRHRGVTSDGEYTYALVAVDHQNRESDAVSVTVR